jgi:hypothetical protein
MLVKLTPVQRFDAKNGSELLEQVIGGVLARVVGQCLRPKVDKVFEDEKFSWRAIENDNGCNIVIVDHRPDKKIVLVN